MSCSAPSTRKGDHILAARFLEPLRARRRFPGCTWISPPARAHGGLAHIGTEITGFGVRYTLDLLRRGLAAARRRDAR